MKRILSVLLLTGVMVMPSIAFAGEQVGVYVSPKFVYGATQMNSIKIHGEEAKTSTTDKVGSKTDSVFGGSIAIGYDFDKKFNVPIRTEIEYAAFSKAEAKKTISESATKYNKLKQSFGIQTLFLNAYWDIDTGTKFTPYVGAGLGMAFINTKASDKETDGAKTSKTSTGSKNVTNFAWNAGAGIGYDISESWTMDLGYRFVGLGSVKTKKYVDGTDSYYGKTSNLYQHQVAVGVRYTF